MLQNEDSLVHSENVRKLYNEYSHRYDNLVENTKYIGPVWLEDYLGSTKNINRVLDIGCANGFDGKIIKKYFPDCEINGIDISDEMVKFCKETGKYTNVYVHDCSNGLLPNLGKYDMVIANGCLEFVRNHRKLFEDTKNSLNKNGILMMTLQKTTPGTEEVFGIKLTTYENKQAVYDLLEEIGFSIINIDEKIGFYSEDGLQQFYYFMLLAKIKN